MSERTSDVGDLCFVQSCTGEREDKGLGAGQTGLALPSSGSEGCKMARGPVLGFVFL